MLANEFSSLPSQILASTFPTLGSSGSVSNSTFSTNLHVKPMLLSKSLFEGIRDRHRTHSIAKLSYVSSSARLNIFFLPKPLS